MGLGPYSGLRTSLGQPVAPGPSEKPIGITMPPPIYQPPPTDAVILLVGWQSQPANPLFFTSDAEAMACLSRLKAAGIVPQNATLVDSPWAIGPVIYGHDGRKVWCVYCTVPSDDGQVNISEPVGKILWMEATYPNKRLYIDVAASGISMRNSD